MLARFQDQTVETFRARRTPAAIEPLRPGFAVVEIAANGDYFSRSDGLAMRGYAPDISLGAAKTGKKAARLQRRDGRQVPFQLPSPCLTANRRPPPVRKVEHDASLRKTRQIDAGGGPRQNRPRSNRPATWPQKSGGCADGGERPSFWRCRTRSVAGGKSESERVRVPRFRYSRPASVITSRWRSRLNSFDAERGLQCFDLVAKRLPG